MKGKALFLFTISIGLVAFAAVQTWVADTQKAKVQFIAKGPFGKVNGHFSGFKSEIIFDENNLSSSSIRASVDVKTGPHQVVTNPAKLLDRQRSRAAEVKVVPVG